MGSSFLHPGAVPLAIFFSVLYLIFDAARYFVTLLGPMRMRRWSGPETNGENKNRAFFFDPDHFTIVSGALLQISLVGAVAATAAAFESYSVSRPVLYATLSWLVVVLIWKFLLVLIPEDIAEIILRTIVPVSYIFYYLFWPLLAPLRWIIRRVTTRRQTEDDEEDVTEEEIQAFIDVGAEEGILEEDDKKLVESVVEFGNRIARELMTPRVDVLAVAATTSVETMARLFSESKYSRIPIYEKNIDQVTGIVHVKDLFDLYLRHEEKPITEIARPAYFISETKKVSELLREFQIEHLQMAIVVDEYGGTSGVITIEDVVEQIVGDIADEHEDEDEQSIIEVEPGVFMASGLTKVEALEPVFGVPLEGPDYETVAGLIFTHTGRVPKVGELIEKNGLQFEIDRADRRRIYRVRIMRLRQVEQPQEVESE